MNALKTPPFLSKTFVIFFDAMALSAILLATTYMMFDAGVSSIVIPVVFFSGVIVICMVLAGVYKTRRTDKLLQITGRTLLAFIAASVLLQAGVYFGVFTGMSQVITGVPVALAFFALGTLRPLTLKQQGPSIAPRGEQGQQGA